MLQTAVHFSHTLLKEVVCPDDIVIDATMGNGHDTKFLAELVQDSGHVYAFDIQEKALQQTTARLTHTNLLHRVTLLQQGHESLAELLPFEREIAAAIFNLGYLPHGDKQITTKAQTTQEALIALLPHLRSRGRIVLVIYDGHDGGLEELQRITHYCQHLPQKQFNVLNYQFINQANNPPRLLCIEKK